MRDTAIMFGDSSTAMIIGVIKVLPGTASSTVMIKKKTWLACKRQEKNKKDRKVYLGQSAVVLTIQKHFGLAFPWKSLAFSGARLIITLHSHNNTNPSKTSALHYVLRIVFFKLWAGEWITGPRKWVINAQGVHLQKNKIPSFAIITTLLNPLWAINTVVCGGLKAYKYANTAYLQKSLYMPLNI